MTERAEVVVVGGGVVGTSVAYHLARAGVTDVLLLEARGLGAGSSGKPLGGVRAQFSDPLNIRFGARGVAAYRRFPDEVGVDIGLRQVGYLFLLHTPDDVDRFVRGVAAQNALGVPSRLVDAAEAARLCPYLATDGLLAAAYCPDDGFARPGAVVRGYAAAAARLGVRIRTGCPVEGVDVRGGEITGVRTPHGTVATGAVVCAAGAWSAAVGALAGVDLPVTPLRRQVAFTAPMAAPRVPFTIDYASTAYFHPSDDGLLLGMADPAQPAGFDTTYTEDWLPGLRAALMRCAPALADLPLGRGWAGLYEMTPDCNALIGEAPEVGRFLYATGFSGHGFLQAPAAGEVVADLYRGRTPFCDVQGFDAARFAPAGGRPATRTEVTIV